MADNSASPSIDRADLRHAYRQEEEACIAERLEQAAPAARVHAEAAALAVDDGPRPNPGSWCDRCSYRGICPASRERLFYHRLIRTLILPLIATRWHAIKAELHVRATYCA